MINLTKIHDTYLGKVNIKLDFSQWVIGSNKYTNLKFSASFYSKFRNPCLTINQYGETEKLNNSLIFSIYCELVDASANGFNSYYTPSEIRQIQNKIQEIGWPQK